MGILEKAIFPGEITQAGLEGPQGKIQEKMAISRNKNMQTRVRGNKSMKRIYLTFLYAAILSSLLLPRTGAALDMDLGYDQSGRLTHVSMDSGQKTISYQYDADGNLGERGSEGGGENMPPLITSFTADPTYGIAPLAVAFTCEAYDPEGSIAEYRWDLDGDGVVDDITISGTTTYTYDAVGSYNATCTAADDQGATTASEAVTILVGNMYLEINIFDIFWYNPDGNRDLSSNVITYLDRKLDQELDDMDVPIPWNAQRINILRSLYSDDRQYFPPWTSIPFDIIGNNADIDPALGGQYGYFSNPWQSYSTLDRVQLNGGRLIRSTERIFGVTWGVPNELPVIDSFAVEPSSGTAPLDVAVICQATDPDGNIASYQFNPGDGNGPLTSPDGTFSYTYQSLDTYQATCTAYDDQGAHTVSEPVTVTVAEHQNQPPAIDSFSVSPTSGEAPLSVTAVCQASDADGSVSTYRFDPGDGSRAVESASGSFSHTYAVAGSYGATCTVVDDEGAETTSEPVTVSVAEHQPVWQDVTGAIEVSRSRTLLDRINRSFFVFLDLTNGSGAELAGPVRMVLRNATLPLKESAPGLDPDGYTEGGDPYFVLVPVGGTWAAGATLEDVRLDFVLQRKRLDFELRFEQLQ